MCIFALIQYYYCSTNMDNMQYNNNDNKEKAEVSDDDDIESKLIRQTNEEEKARKRTRGPYESHPDLLLVHMIKAK
jgi:hypothetical protein